MSYTPEFSISPALLAKAEEIAALRERTVSAGQGSAWIPSLQKDARARMVHATLAVEGGPATLEQVRELEDAREGDTGLPAWKLEILDAYAALRHVEKHAKKARMVPDDLVELHRILAAHAVEPGEAGRYRAIALRAGRYLPPPPHIPDLIAELLEWWNKESVRLPPILSSSILHYRLEAIHPFARANGRISRMAALWDRYRRGFDPYHIFPAEEYFLEDAAGYLRQLDSVQKAGENLSAWLEYCAEGLRQTLDGTWIRIQSLGAAPARLILRPRQEELLRMMRERGGLAPREIWGGLGISRQGALDLLRPLVQGGIVERVGGRKTGRYALKARRIP